MGIPPEGAIHFRGSLGRIALRMVAYRRRGGKARRDKPATRDNGVTSNNGLCLAAALGGPSKLSA
jgi:hypothetical protein